MIFISSSQKLSPEDLRQIISLSQESLPSNPHSEKTRRDFLTHDKSRILITRSDENTVIGFLHIWDVSDGWEILDIVVAEKWRRKKTAQNMLKKIFSKARTKKIEQIRLEVSEKNLPAFKLYTKMGFEEIARRRSYYKDGSDALMMAKKITLSSREKRSSDEE